MYEDHELLDLFDINENIVGTIERAEYYKNLSQYKDVYLRSAELLIVNDKGQLCCISRLTVTMIRQVAVGPLQSLDHVGMTGM